MSNVVERKFLQYREISTKIDKDEERLATAKRVNYSKTKVGGYAA